VAELLYTWEHLSSMLVLSLSTGLVSPQFHLKFDDEFITLSSKINNNIPLLLWQTKCGFLSSNNSRTTSI
jgi:hypothetical protein